MHKSGIKARLRNNETTRLLWKPGRFIHPLHVAPDPSMCLTLYCLFGAQAIRERQCKLALPATCTCCISGDGTCFQNAQNAKYVHCTQTCEPRQGYVKNPNSRTWRTKGNVRPKRSSTLTIGSEVQLGDTKGRRSASTKGHIHVWNGCFTAARVQTVKQWLTD